MAVRTHKLNAASGVLTGTAFTANAPDFCMGFSLRNTSATHSVVVILSGTKTTAGTKAATTTNIIAEIALGKATATAPAVDVVTTQWFGPQGITVYGAIYVTITGTGTPVGGVFVG